MINFLKYCIVDIETTGINPERCQPIEIAAVMIDPRKLEVYENGTFQSYCNIIPDEFVAEYDLDPTDPKALAVNKIDMETINSAPCLKLVWQNFINWFSYHNPSNDQWKGPIMCGQNVPFDAKIIDRIQHGHLGGYRYILTSKPIVKTNLKRMSDSDIASAYRALSFYKEPWKFNNKKIFHPALRVDILQQAIMWWESNKNPHRFNQDAIKEFLGLSSEGAHSALIDCLYTAEILIRFLSLTRTVSEETEFENSCTDGTKIPIDKLYNNHFKDANVTTCI